MIEQDSPSCGYSFRYLTLVPRSAATTFKFSGNSINYSLDNGLTWKSLASNAATPSVGVGEKIMFKASLTINYGIGKFSGSSQFDVEGNAMSLLYGDNFSGKTSLSGKNFAFYGLFSGSSVVDASGLVLPATVLSEHCYDKMFKDCHSLTTAPQLPATTLASSCYVDMFQYCTSLTVAPELPATTLVYGCYSKMFNYCSGLTVAPQLPATTLAKSCYEYMFNGCTSLNSITCLATDISASYCTDSWLSRVASNGTFYKASGMSSWGSGASGIPTNWTIVDYQE